MARIKPFLKDTDNCGRYIANLLIGTLSENCAFKPYLIATKELEKTNHVTTSRFIQERFTNIVLPNSILIRKIVLILSDVASYKVGIYIFKSVLSNYYTLHLCCYGVTRVPEEIRN